MRIFLSIVVALLILPSAVPAKPFVPLASDPSRGYVFMMIVPCRGHPSGFAKVPIDQLEEVEAVKAFIEGNLHQDTFKKAMLAADPSWSTGGLDTFIHDCKPAPRLEG